MAKEAGYPDAHSNARAIWKIRRKLGVKVAKERPLRTNKAEQAAVPKPKSKHSPTPNPTAVFLRGMPDLISLPKETIRSLCRKAGHAVTDQQIYKEIYRARALQRHANQLRRLENQRRDLVNILVTSCQCTPHIASEVVQLILQRIEKDNAS